MDSAPASTEVTSNETAAFWRAARGYWGACPVPAWSLTLTLLALIVANLFIQVQLNNWHKDFFNALEKKEIDALPMHLTVFLAIVLSSAFIASLMVLVRYLLTVNWRGWITAGLIGRWVSGSTYRNMSISKADQSAPEYRIADDVRLATEPFIDLAAGLVNVWLLGVTFIEVLARVGGGYRLPVMGGIDVPYYFVIAAVIYAVLMSTLTWFVGNPLITAIEAKNQHEGLFRYELTTFRENAQAIARDGASGHAHGLMARALAALIARWKTVARGLARVMMVTDTHNGIVVVLPLLIAAPKYMAGQMSLGDAMQVSAAFIQVQMALNWVVNNFVRVAEWRASANRVGQVIVAMERAREPAAS